MLTMRSLFSHLAGFLLLLASVGGHVFCSAFVSPSLSAVAPSSIMTNAAAAATTSTSMKQNPTARKRGASSTSSALYMGLLDGLKRFTDRATASHILLSFAPDAESRLEEMKAEIDNSPVKFAEFAQLYSECPSSSAGGSLGEFGRGAMVKEFDEVVFNEELNKVHGPVETKFGYHLIYVSQRSD